MPHKSITVSEEAYRVLLDLKEGKESFSDVILRLARRENARELLAVLAEMGPDDELADSIEKVYRDRKRIRAREVSFD